MNVSVIFIGTGKYLNFLPKWHENCEKYFLPEVHKKYLIFTDGKIEESPENSVIYKQEHLDWPYITLYRFKILKKAIDEIKKTDWVVFLDADMLPVDCVNPDDIFDESKKYLGVHHPCHYMMMPPHNQSTGAFETKSISNAAITSEDDTSIYYQGCLWGSKSEYFEELICELDRRIDDDLSKNVIAEWHDESHLNKFYAENSKDVNVLSPSYAYPEVFSDHCTFEPKIIHLAKDNSKYHV